MVTGNDSEFQLIGCGTLTNVGHMDGSVGQPGVLADGKANATSLEAGIGPTGAAPGPTKASGTVDIDDPNIALTALAEVLAKKGDLAGAKPLIRRPLEVQQRTLPADHPDTGLSMWHLAETLRGLKRLDEAERHVRESLRIRETAFGAGHEWTAWGRISLAEARLARGDAAEAAEQAAQAAAALANTYGADHPVVASTWVLQARALLALQRPADAEALLQRALAVHQAHDDAQPSPNWCGSRRTGARRPEGPASASTGQGLPAPEVRGHPAFEG